MPNTINQTSKYMVSGAETCPLCGSSVNKVIIYGLPGYLCPVDDCRCAWGLGYGLADIIAFDGWQMVYEGNYWRALWHWLFGKREVNESP